MSLETVDYDTKIPNNVNLSGDRKLQRALEKWHPGFIDWWLDMGPSGFQDNEVYLRTAVGVDPGGWAQFGFVKMPEYRWGILLAPKEEGRTIPFGQHAGEPAWQEVPGEHRAMLRRLITIQGDTEPASVEQQRLLGKTAPSLYDLRNLFQVNVEEGRHLWAMVYLLHAYFGRDGREEADELLKRRSGNQDAPRILGAFNENTASWLAFFMFTTFTDRDGKFQLESLAQSGFDPLSRTCRFMLTEEAHHMFVGEDGVKRIIQRTVDAMNEADITDPHAVEKIHALGVIDLPLLQKYIHFHFPVSEDLFGAETSTNAANAFTAGVKGRFRETKIDDDHKLENATYPVMERVNGGFQTVEHAALQAINARLRDDYINECASVVKRWNRVLEQAEIDFAFALPHQAFNRQVGHFSDHSVSPQGEVMSEQEWEKHRDEWLPTRDEYAYVESLMQACYDPGKTAGWIAAPKVPVDKKSGDFEFVKLEG